MTDSVAAGDKCHPDLLAPQTRYGRVLQNKGTLNRFEIGQMNMWSPAGKARVQGSRWWDGVESIVIERPTEQPNALVYNS